MYKNNHRLLRLGLKGLLFAFVGSSMAWATISSCTPVETALSATGLTPSYSPTSATVGCTTTDLQFTNFTVGSLTSGAAIINGVPIAVNSAGVTSPTSQQIFAGNFAGDGLRFDSLLPGGTTSGTAPDLTLATQGVCKSNSGNQGYCVQGAQVRMNSTVTYTITIESGFQGILGLSGTAVSHSSGGGSGVGGATAVTFREICIGTSTFTTDANGTSTCSGTYFSLQGGAINGNFNTIDFNKSVAVGLLAPGTLIAVRDTVYLTSDNGNGSFAYLLPFDFLDSPEPATFGLMGSALAGLIALGYRRRKKA
jgi:hypothetical protein